MVEIDSYFQIFTTASILVILLSFLIKVSIQALLLRYFTKKHKLSQNYSKAWLAILIPSLIFTFFTSPLASIKLSDLFTIIIWFLFFPLLFFSVKLVYKTETRTSISISFKFFLVIIILLIAFAGIQTIYAKTINPRYCTIDCDFLYSLDGSGPLTVTGYDIPTIKSQKRQKIILAQKTFYTEELNSLKSGEMDGNNNPIIKGKLDVNGCNYMEFNRDGRNIGKVCRKFSKNLFTNLQKILTR